MAHNINTYIGRQAAWHKLGTVTGKYQTWAEILAHGGLDFDVFKEQLMDWRGELVKAWGVYRWDAKDKAVGNKDAAKFLGAVGEGYLPLNHSVGFELSDLLMQSVDGAHYETAGVLGEGETVWGLADLDLAMNIGDDKHKCYLLFTTGHIGNETFQVCLVDERVVCENTLKMALSEKAKSTFRIKHTKNAQNRIADVKQTLDAIRGDVMSMEQKLQKLAQKRVTKASLENIMDKLFPQRKDEKGEKVDTTRRTNILRDILTLYDDNDGNAFPEQRGTAYNLLNSITNYVDHERSSKGGNRAESALFGSGDKMKTNALDLIIAEAEGMPDVRSYGKGVSADDVLTVASDGSVRLV